MAASGLDQRPWTRVFSDAYDSVQQHERIGGDDATVDAAAAAGYIARLRLDLIFGRTVVLTDAQLLDGRFFLGMGPDEFARWVPLNSIEIRTRAGDLATTLCQLPWRPDGTSKGFYFSFLPPADATWVDSCLKKSGPVPDWESLARLIKAILGPGRDARADGMIDAWGRWISVVGRPDGPRVAKWEGEFPLDPLLEASAKAASPEERQVHPLSVDWISHEKDRFNRSTVFRTYMALMEQARDEIERAQLTTAWSSYNQTYNRALAMQHGCGWSDFADDAGARPVGPLRRAFDEINDALDRVILGPKSRSPALPPRLFLPEAFVSKLGTLDRAWYDHQRAKASVALDEWRNSDGRAVSALSRAVEVLAEDTVTSEGRLPVPEWAVPRLKVIARESVHAVEALGGPLGYVAGAIIRGSAALLKPERRIARRFVEYVQGRNVG